MNTHTTLDFLAQREELVAKREELVARRERQLAEREAQAQPAPHVTPHEAPPFVDAAAGAKLALCSVKHLQHLARTGKIPSYRCGRHLRFKPSEIVAYLEGGK